MGEGACKREERFRAAPLPYELKDMRDLASPIFYERKDLSKPPPISPALFMHLVTDPFIWPTVRQLASLASISDVHRHML
jgi:hypothetical protein